LIVTDGTGKWSIVRQQSILFRTIDHKQVRGVCEDIVGFAKKGDQVPAELLQVAKAFVQLIGQRHEADYNNTTTWLRTEVIRSLQLATDAFAPWKAVRMSDEAHDFCSG
jgi:hypothetical protein